MKETGNKTGSASEPKAEKIRILPAITTTGQNWRELIAEAGRLQLAEVAFFPTAISKTERQEAYSLLKASGVKKIPFVHLRSDMAKEELDLLTDTFGTEIFNIHPEGVNKLEHNLSAYNSRIYCETQKYMSDGEIGRLAGICLDVSHLENWRYVNKPLAEEVEGFLQRYPIGCGHISAVRTEIGYDEREKIFRHDFHFFRDLAEFDYLAKYSRLLPPIMALELEDPLAEQLIAKKYIQSLLKREGLDCSE